MKTKKLLLFTLLLRIFSADIALPAQPANDGYGATFVALMGALAHATTAYSNVQNGKQLEANTEIAKITEEDRHKKHLDDLRKANIDTNSSILTGLKEAQSIYKADHTPEGKKELAEINRVILHFSKFMRDGRNDKEIFDAAKYPVEVPQQSSASEVNNPEKKEPTPGMLKQAAMFAATAPFLAADKIADTLKINAAIARLVESEKFKGGLLEAHQKNIGQAAALAIAAGTLGAIYKAYSWYNNEDRIIAQETVLELENQQKEIALQFNKEIQKATLSAEEKAKLIKAYENYMDELQDEINEQKAIAGYRTIAGYKIIPAKIAMIALAAAGGITGLTALAKFYLSKPVTMPHNETDINQPTENNDSTDTIQTEGSQPDQSGIEKTNKEYTDTNQQEILTTESNESGLTTIGKIGFGALGTAVVGVGYFLTDGFSGIVF